MKVKILHIEPNKHLLDFNGEIKPVVFKEVSKSNGRVKVFLKSSSGDTKVFLRKYKNLAKDKIEVFTLENFFNDLT